MKQIFYFLAFTAIAFVVSHQASAQNNQRWNYTYSRGNGDYRDACMQSFLLLPAEQCVFQCYHTSVCVSLSRFLGSFRQASASMAASQRATFCC